MMQGDQTEHGSSGKIILHETVFFGEHLCLFMFVHVLDDLNTQADLLILL